MCFPAGLCDSQFESLYKFLEHWVFSHFIGDDFLRRLYHNALCGVVHFHIYRQCGAVERIAHIFHHLSQVWVDYFAHGSVIHQHREPGGIFQRGDGRICHHVCEKFLGGVLRDERLPCLVPLLSGDVCCLRRCRLGLSRCLLLLLALWRCGCYRGGCAYARCGGDRWRDARSG